jgi:hypothetical protein
VAERDETRDEAGGLRRLARRWLAPRRRGAAACFVVATLGAVALGWPVLQDPGERLLGRELVGRKHDPYTVIEQFERPRSPNLRTQPATDYVGAVLTRVVGDGVVAYNVFMLATFPLAALFAFLFAHHLTGSAPVAWTAGLLYAFSPFHVAHVAYHPHIAQIQWVPLALLALWRAVEHADLRRVVLLLASLSLVALSNFYFGLVVGVLLPLLLVAAWRSRDSDAGGRPAIELARVAGTLGALAGAAWLYARLFAPQVLRDADSLAWPRRDLVEYTARWWSYLLPPVDHPAFDGVARRVLAGHGVRGGIVEHQVTIGFGVALLATAGAALWLRDRRRRELRAVPGLVLVAAVAFLLSLQPDWTLGGVTFRGPSGWLYELAPMFRAHARFALVVGLVAYLLAGLALDRAWRGSSRLAKGAAAALLAVAVFELTPLPPWRWRDVLPTAAHRWLKENRPPGKILDCAPVPDIEQRAVPRLFGPGLERLLSTSDCGEPGFAGKVAARGVTTVIVQRASRGAAALLSRPLAAGLAPLRDFPDAVVWRVTASPSPLTLELGRAFHLREYSEAGSFRWMPSGAELTAINHTGAPTRVRLELRLHAFPGPREVTLLAPGGAAFTAAVGTTPAPHRFGPFDLAPGRYPLELRTATPAVVADDVLRNGDRRRLAIGLWEWSFVAAEAADAASPASASPATP